jgi:hypothetical protein
MTDADKSHAIKAVLSESRNGANRFTRCMFSPREVSLVVSDGATDLADAAGCHWLIDILSTEATLLAWRDIESGDASTFDVYLIKQEDEDNCEIVVTRNDLDPDDHKKKALFYKRISYTDFPAGSWRLFMVGYFGEDEARGNRPALSLILPSEY